MTTEEFLLHMARGERVVGGSEVHRTMHRLSEEVRGAMAALNTGAHTDEEIRRLFFSSSESRTTRRSRSSRPFTPTAERTSRWGSACLSIRAAAFRTRAAF